MRELLIKSKFYLAYTDNFIQRKRNFNICFIHIPKTGGKSLLLNLEKQTNMIKINKNNEFKYFPNFGSVTFGHVQYLALLKSGFVSDEYHRSSYKFAVVRNPYDRIVSLYNYLNGRSELEDGGFDRFLDQVLNERPPVGLYNKDGISQSNPQTDWITGDDGEFITDDIFKIEDLEKLRKKFYDLFSIELNMSRRKNISKKYIYVNEDVFLKTDRVEKINNIYKNDFVMFDYKMI